MITHVAIKDINGNIWSVPKPYRHGHIFLMNKQKGINNEPLRNGIQGFINDKNEFLDRKEAFYEAFKSAQILPPMKPNGDGERNWNLKPDPTPRELFSEDIW